MQRHFSDDQAVRPGRGPVVTKAALNAADRLGFSAKVLGKVLGVSPATVSRMRSRQYALEEESKSYQLALLFIRVYRSLDAITGGDDSVAASWMKNPNLVLGEAPEILIQNPEGLSDVLRYLDTRRAPV